MTKDLGNKHTCFSCQTKFYDMKKPAPICPKCGADQREMPAAKTTERKRAAAPASRLEAVEEEEDLLKEPEAEEDEEEVEEEEEP